MKKFKVTLKNYSITTHKLTKVITKYYENKEDAEYDVKLHSLKVGDIIITEGTVEEVDTMGETSIVCYDGLTGKRLTKKNTCKLS